MKEEILITGHKKSGHRFYLLSINNGRLSKKLGVNNVKAVRIGKSK